MNIHYNTTTGQIMSYGFGADCECCSDSYFPGCKVLMRDYDSIDPKTEKIDIVLLEKVPKAEPDSDPFAIWQVKAAVRQELIDTDYFLLPHAPISEADLPAWIEYRKALRDSSKGRTTPADVLAVIPLRPDGVDGFEWLRSQLAAPGA